MRMKSGRCRTGLFRNARRGGIVLHRGGNAEVVAVGVVVDLETEFAGCGVDMLQNFSFHGLELAPARHLRVAVDIQSYAVGLRGIHRDEHILILRVDLRMAHQIGADICAEEAQIGVDRAVDAVSIIVFLGEDGLARGLM